MIAFRVLLLPVFLTLVLGSPVVADEEPDLELGEEIYDTCAPCHGPFGQGGGGGVYPRLAGMPAEFIAEQLRRFKDRERENIPMIPYANERELPEKTSSPSPPTWNGSSCRPVCRRRIR